MVILGLGCNLGDRLYQLRQAFELITTIDAISVKKISPIYESNALLPSNATVQWALPYYNCALRCETDLEPLALLAELKAIELQIGRKPAERWAPRLIDIDILAWDNLVYDNAQLKIPHPGLLERPFALWPLADVAPSWQYPVSSQQQGQYADCLIAKWGSRFSKQAPLNTYQILPRLTGPQIVGILNLSANSFSKDGLVDERQVEQRVLAMINEGAEIIDVGAVATNPFANDSALRNEWQRLQPMLDVVLATKERRQADIKISVDTFSPNVIRQLQHYPIDWINDQTGLVQPEMVDLLLDTEADVVVMHHLAIPEDRNQSIPYDQDVVAVVASWCQQRIEQLLTLGFSQQRLIIDPGIGFGKQAFQSLALLQQAKVFTTLGVRSLFGYSRKSFLSLFTSQIAADRSHETVAVTAGLASQGIDYLRVHDVAANRRALNIALVMEKD